MPQALAQTFAKQEEGHENQDAFYWQPSAQGAGWRFALSDGAGGTGALSAAWAQALVENLPAQPLKNAADIDAWINGWVETFLQAAESELTVRPHLRNKFYLEGSAATLVAAWGDGESIDVLSYGDSFYALQIGENWHFPAQRRDMLQYQQHPYLLNWAVENTPDIGLSYQKFALPTDAHWQLFACTDALGQYLLSLYQCAFERERLEALAQNELHFMSRLHRLLSDEQAPTWADFWTNLPTHLSTEQAFADWCGGLLAADLVAVDDITALWLR